MRPKISIIIPVYNAQEYLDKCISSFYDFLSCELECVIVDDGSTDKSMKICESYAKKNHFVRIIKSKNCGVSAARNLALEYVNGEYLMFLDADDYLVSGWKRRVDNILKKQYDVVVFSNEYDEFAYDKRVLLKACLGYSGTILDHCSLMSVCSKLYRTDFIRKHRLSFKNDIINGEDLLFDFEAIINARRITVAKAPIYYYRDHRASSSKNFDDRIIESDKRFHDYLNRLVVANNYGNILSEAQELAMLNGVFIMASSMAATGNKKIIPSFLNEFTNRETVCAIRSLLKKHKYKVSFFRRCVIQNVLCGRIKISILLIKVRRIIAHLVKYVAGGKNGRII